MKKTSGPIVFFGSGPVAAKSLRLLAQDFTIEAVITKPKPAHHRGEVPVLLAAEELNLQVRTAENKRQLDDLFSKRPFKSEIGILIDFGIIVSKEVIDYFPLGIVNSHFSILPEWRGADPITFAVLSGQQQTGISLMLLVEAMDEGPLLAYGVHDLSANVNTPELTDYLIQLSYALIKDIVPKYISGEIKASPQSITGREVSYSRKLSKEDGLIDWSKPATILEREIRAYAGWPKSRTYIVGLEAIITKAHVIDVSGKPGERTVLDKLPIVYCGRDALAIDRLKLAGKKEMTGEALLAGYKKQFLG